MGCTSVWAHPIPSPNSNGRPCRGSSKHPDLTSADMVGGKPPMYALNVCTSRCSGRKTQSKTRATCLFVLAQKVSPTMTRQTPRLEVCVDNPARARRGELAAKPEYVGFEDNSPQLKCRFLQGVSWAKGTTSFDGFDGGSGCGRMGGWEDGRSCMTDGM
jgi:hypothetical protein